MNGLVAPFIVERLHPLSLSLPWIQLGSLELQRLDELVTTNKRIADGIATVTVIRQCRTETQY